MCACIRMCVCTYSPPVYLILCCNSSTVLPRGCYKCVKPLPGWPVGFIWCTASASGPLTLPGWPVGFIRCNTSASGSLSLTLPGWLVGFVWSTVLASGSHVARLVCLLYTVPLRQPVALMLPGLSVCCIGCPTSASGSNVASLACRLCRLLRSLSRFVCLIYSFYSFVKSDGLLRNLPGNRKLWNKC